MHGIRYRRCRRKDLDPALRLILRATGDLRRRTGKAPIPWHPRTAPPFFVHLYSTDPKTFACAWSGEKLVGFAAALLRGKQWYLAFLFVDTAHQGRGIGRELLRRVWRDGPGMTHALGTFTYNQQAVGLYTSFGMAPHELLTLLEGRPPGLGARGGHAIDVSSDWGGGDIAWVNRLERKIRGYPHPEEWRFWTRSAEHRVFLLRREGRPIGYGVFGPRGEIQPVGVAAPRDLVGAVDALIRRSAADGRENIRIFCPNRNRELYLHLHRLGLRNTEMDLFLTDKPYGDFTRYVPAPLSIF